ncbi:MAG: hypothetical protein ACREDP_20910, partial [Bradyrhizobium sp.]
VLPQPPQEDQADDRNHRQLSEAHAPAEGEILPCHIERKPDADFKYAASFEDPWDYRRVGFGSCDAS